MPRGKGHRIAGTFPGKGGSKHKKICWTPYPPNTGFWNKKRGDRKVSRGLPWWRSGWESTCRCRGHGFVPRSGRIPRAAERLSP